MSEALAGRKPPEDAAAGVPDGFKRLNVTEGYLARLGPLYARRAGEGRAVIGLRVTADHLNGNGVTHGGMLTTLADSALGINITFARGRRTQMVTVALTADFLSGAREGEWLTAHVDITRMGRRLIYANCDLRVEDRHVLRSSAVFSIVERAEAPDQAKPKSS